MAAGNAVSIQVTGPRPDGTGPHERATAHVRAHGRMRASGPACEGGARECRAIRRASPIAKEMSVD
ncbi:MAG: hypothetical protein WAW52_01425 [Methanothrix sp.]